MINNNAGHNIHNIQEPHLWGAVCAQNVILVIYKCEVIFVNVSVHLKLCDVIYMNVN